jgi:hypothetical protein
MPLHMTGLISRHELDHPNEKPLKKPEPPLNYERVLKFNPNHGADGKFSSGGGGRKGGTAGAPTEDAMGRPLKNRKVPAAALESFLGMMGGSRETPQQALRRVVSGSGKPPIVEQPSGGRRNLPERQGGVFDNNPVGTIYENDQFIVPTNERVKVDPKYYDQKNHPDGTIYSTNGTTMIPNEGGYFDLQTGKVFKAYRYKS